MGANPETVRMDDPDYLRADIERRREEIGDTLDAIGDRVSPGRMIERRRNRMADGVRGIRERIVGTVSDGAHRVGDATGSATDSMKDAPDVIREQTAGRPLAAGMVSFGLGFLVAAALPKSDPEARAARALMEKAGPIKDELASAGREVMEDVKQEATERGRRVADEASAAASSVTQTAKHEAAAAKEEIRPSGGSNETLAAP